MDNTRITIALEQQERSALMKLASAELRSPRDQARFVLRRELVRCGLLPPTDQDEKPHAAEVLSREADNA